MKDEFICQQDFELDLYDHLDVVISAKVEMIDREVNDFKFEINGHEIIIDSANPAYNQIYKALKVRIDNKIDDIVKEERKWFSEAKAEEMYEEYGVRV